MNIAKSTALPFHHGPGLYSPPTVHNLQNRLVGIKDGTLQEVIDHAHWFHAEFWFLRAFYGSKAYKRNNWDRRKAFRAEYDWAVAGILRCAGLDVKVNEKVGTRKVLFVYGGASFNTRTQLSTLHTTLKGHFFKKVRPHPTFCSEHTFHLLR
jgi:hypothetical protein